MYKYLSDNFTRHLRNFKTSLKRLQNVMIHWISLEFINIEFETLFFLSLSLSLPFFLFN